MKREKEQLYSGKAFTPMIKVKTVSKERIKNCEPSDSIQREHNITSVIYLPKRSTPNLIIVNLTILELYWS